MKKAYIKPTVELEEIILEDVITTSITADDNGNGSIINWDDIFWH